jgi:rare lipoprotein A
MFMFSHQLFRAMSVLAVGGLTILLGGCAARQGLIVEPDKPEIVYDAKPVAVLHGKASYYYGRWIGRLTANGETYRATDVTAAHKTLPFNTMVRVTNLNNSKSVIVRINNRGPYIKGRILDLSLVAAQQIEMTKAGVVPVKAEILRRIELLPKPNRRITLADKRAAEKRAQQEAREVNQKKSETTSGLSKVFSFLRPAP